MTTAAIDNDYALITEPATLTLERLLPGPIDRVWAYLTDGDLRRQWLAAGTMETTVGSSVELVWRNRELTEDPGQRPENASEENRMICEVTEYDAPHRLGISWGNTGGVTFALEAAGDEVRLTVTHRRIEERSTLLSISAGWHAHLDVLIAKLQASTAAPFWDEWVRLRAIYDQRIPA